MDLELELFAALRERAGRARLELRGLPETLTVEELKRAAERAHPELGSLAHVAVVVGTSYARAGQSVRAGDEVALLPPVSGG